MTTQAHVMGGCLGVRRVLFRSSPYFVTDAESMEAVLENAYVLLHREKISAIADLLPLLEKVLADGSKPLLIVAEDVEGEALSTQIGRASCRERVWSL